MQSFRTPHAVPPVPCLAWPSYEGALVQKAHCTPADVWTRCGAHLPATAGVLGVAEGMGFSQGCRACLMAGASHASVTTARACSVQAQQKVLGRESV